MEELAATLAAVRGVAGVTLTGSRATGEAREDSDWDFGVYVRGRLDRAGLTRAVAGREGVELLVRELDAVERRLEEVLQGRFEIEAVPWFVAGRPTYTDAAELGVARVLAGELPRPEFPEALREAAPPRWLDVARAALAAAEGRAERGDVVSVTGLEAKAALALAQARLAERGEWVLGEKGLLRRAGLTAVESVLAAVGTRPLDLSHSLRRLRVALALPRLESPP